MKEPLGKWTLEDAYVSALIRGRGGNFMRPGSQNAMATGLGFIRAFRGVTLQAGKLGSRVFFNTDQSYAGLGSATLNGAGSVFQVRELLHYIGAGQVAFNGAAISGVSASSTLSLIKKSGGAYASGALTGPFQSGHAQPSAATIYPKDIPSANQTPITGAISIVIWRVSSITGQVSLMSLPSNVLVLNNQTVIVQFPLKDSNGQDLWGIGVPKILYADLGVFYQLPISLQGEVEESVLSYTRTVTGASIDTATSIVNVTDADVADQFTSADIGRRISFSTFDSWITAVNSATQVVVADENDSGLTISGDATIIHAVQGITRAVEISWTNGALFGQALAPGKAFPPPAGQFGGAINDVVWMESEGIIYVGEPGFTGSFPPSNSLFPPEPGILYLRAADGLTVRFGKNHFGALYYVGGSPALEYQTIWENQGIMFPQNACLGANGRILVWLGRPTVLDGIEPDFGYAADVLPDFAGWEAQTATSPIVPGHDALGQYEVWCYQKKVMAKHVPTNKWCSPIDLTGKVSGNVVSAVTFENKLFLCTSDGADLSLYQFDVGTGSVMIIQTSDVKGNGYGDTINEVMAQGRVDNTANPVTIQAVTNFNDTTPITVGAQTPSAVGVQDFGLVDAGGRVRPFRPNILGVKQHSLKITMTSVGGTTVNGLPMDCGIDVLETKGATSGIV